MFSKLFFGIMFIIHKRFYIKAGGKGARQYHYCCSTLHCLLSTVFEKSYRVILELSREHEHLMRES